jgi:predicted nuclease with TOPRIM domain
MTTCDNLFSKFCTKAECEEVKRRLGALENKFNQLDSRMSAIEFKVEELYRFYSALNQAIAQLHQQFQQLQGYFNQHINAKLLGDSVHGGLVGDVDVSAAIDSGNGTLKIFVKVNPFGSDSATVSIKGLKGDKGEKGIKGDNGKDGKKGIEGKKGDKGDNGERGLTGLSGKDGRDANLSNLTLTHTLTYSNSGILRLTTFFNNQSFTSMAVLGQTDITDIKNKLDFIIAQNIGLIAGEVVIGNKVNDIKTDTSNIVTQSNQIKTLIERIKSLLDNTQAVINAIQIRTNEILSDTNNINNTTGQIKSTLNLTSAVVNSIQLVTNDIQNKVNEYKDKFRVILEVLGEKEYPINVPTSLKSDDNGTMQIRNLPHFISWQTKILDELLGSYPIKIRLEDSDLIKVGAQGKLISLPNIAETLAELTGLGLHNQAINNLLVNICFRVLTETGNARNMGVKSHHLLESVRDYLGYKTRHKSIDVPFSFNPTAQFDDENEESFSTALEPSNQIVDIEECSDKQTLEMHLLRVEEMYRLMKARWWRKVNPDDMDKWVDRISYLADGMESGSNNLEDWDGFLNEVEKGFTDQSGITDTEHPYGRPYDQRPRIKKIGE